MLLLLLIFSAAMSTVGAEEPKPPLTVTYVANEGFIVECRDKKIAIDALFGGGESREYVMPSDSVIDLMKTAQPPFDSIDVIAVTHWHHDHFEPGIVMSHLRHNLRGVLVCSPQVAERMQKVDGFSEVSGRIQVISAPVDSVVAINVNALGIVAIPGKHGQYIDIDESTGEKVDLHRDVQHLEYLISMYGRRVYHGGDAPLNDMERYSRLGFGRDATDLALVPWFTPDKIESFRETLIRDVIKGETIVLMHLWPGRDFSAPEHREVCAGRNILVPRTSLETWVVP